MLLGGHFKGTTLGIVGTGRIGGAVAGIASKGFGMKILYYDVVRNKDIERKYKAKKVGLPQLLKRSDFVSLHVPLLPATRHLIGAKQLKMMKETAYLVNTSRGPVVDEKALVAALRKKTIVGAAIDVFEKEPKLAMGLAKLDNVVVTPHIASATVEARSGMSETCAENIIAALSNKRPPNIINPEILRKK